MEETVGMKHAVGRRGGSKGSPSARGSNVMDVDVEDEEPAVRDWITRCPCGNDEDGDFMIQCDKCTVWQHGHCVGISENAVPDYYECDSCNPEQYQERTASLKTKTPQNVKQFAAPKAKVIKRKKPERKGGNGNTGVSDKNLLSKKSSSDALNAHHHTIGVGDLSAGLHLSAQTEQALSLSIESTSLRGEKRQKISSTEHKSVNSNSNLGSNISASASHDGFDENAKLSREDKKLQQYVLSFQLQEKRRKATGGSTSPDQAQIISSSSNMPHVSSLDDFSKHSANRSHLTGVNVPLNTTKKRRNSRTQSYSNDDMMDLDVLKGSPDLLHQLYPLSPMYLGRSTWLSHLLKRIDAEKSSNIHSTPKRSINQSHSQQIGNTWSLKKRMLNRLCDSKQNSTSS